MAYRDFLEVAGSFTVRESPAESDRFGRHVMRGTLGQEAALSDQEVASRIAATDFDLMILRYPAERTLFFSALIESFDGLVLHADTLVYWTLSPESPLSRPLQDRWIVAEEAPTHPVVQESLRKLFSGYTNHYSSNPTLPSEDWLDGYLEWAEGFDRVASGGERFTLVFRDRTTEMMGGLLLCEFGEDVSEVVLGGVEPWARGASLYRHMIAEASWEMRSRSTAPCVVAVSTQVQNRAVQRSWAALGMSPSSAFQTLHLMRI